MIELRDPPCYIPDQGTFTLPGIPGATYTIGRDAVADRVPELLAAGPAGLSIDTEGFGLDGLQRYRLKAVQLSRMDDPSFAVIFDPRDTAQFHMVRDIIEPAAKLYIYNSAHDVHILHVVGLLRDPMQCNKVIDPLIHARLAHPDEYAKHDLAVSAHKYLGTSSGNPLAEILKRMRITKKTWYAEYDLNVPAYVWMAASDPILTARLAEPVRQAAYRTLTEGHPFSEYGVTGDEAWRLVDREQIVNRPMLRRQCKGIPVDEEFIEKYRVQAEPEMERDRAELEAEAVAPGDSASMVRWLDARNLLPANHPTTDGGKPSGQAQDLERIAHPLVSVFLRHKRTTKVLNDYLTKILESLVDGRTRFGTNILAATTGRMSVSGDTPIQQWPEAARGALLLGDATAIDWSQIEVVFAAYLSQDTEFLDLYESEPRDVHQLIADMRLDRPATKDERRSTKAVVFGTIYGEGIRKMAHDLGETQQRAKEIQAEVFRVLPGVHRMCGKGGKLMTVAEEYQMCFTVSGRIIPIGMGKFGVAAHKGVNYPIQGGAYDLLAEGIVESERRGIGDHIHIAMHDELAVDTEAADEFREIMETPPPRLEFIAKRRPILRTSVSHLGERWGK